MTFDVDVAPSSVSDHDRQDSGLSCRICNEFLETIAERAVGVHISCMYKTDDRLAKGSVREPRYGFSNRIPKRPSQPRS